MDKIFVDTNIILDLLAKRALFFAEAQQLFTLADKNKVKLYVSSLTIANTYYVLSHSLKIQDARKIIRKFKILVSVLAVDEKIIDLALDSEFIDFEDAIQYYAAAENGVDLIITRNLKDFKPSIIPVLTAKDYLTSR